MATYILRYDTNYADEFDIEGYFFIESDDIKNDLRVAAEAWAESCYGDRYEYYFGTNEAIDYSIEKWDKDAHTYIREGCDIEGILRDYTYKEVTESELETIVEFFGWYGGQAGPLSQDVPLNVRWRG